MRILALALLIGCGSVANPAVDAKAKDAHSPDADFCATASCDDGDSCTVDSCAASACVHTPMAVTHGQQAFTGTGTIDVFAVPACVRSVTIDAFGGQGGAATGQGKTGGLAAHLVGDFAIDSHSPMLSVLVGKQ